MGLSIITISRQMGSLGDEIAELLAASRNMELVVRERVINDWLPEDTKAYVRRMLAESPKFYLSPSEEGLTYKEYIEHRLTEFTREKPSVVIGMGAQIIFSGNPQALNVRTVASYATRIGRVRREYGVGENEAGSILKRSDRKHKRYIATLYGVDWADPALYDLTLNTDALCAEECARLIGFVADGRNQYRLEAKDAIAERDAYPCFRHPAEIEFAKILDLYNFDWKYEPKTFPVEWDAEGNVTMAFCPDFYLPKFDTYIEITTMNQKYVTIKNKKARKLRELYPGVNVKIVYKKDFRALLERFGDVIGSEGA